MLLEKIYMSNKKRLHLLVLLLMFLSLWSCTSNKKNRIYLTSKSHRANLIIDIDKKRFCFYGIDAGIMGNVFSRGKLEKGGDTLFLISDFSHKKIPIDVNATKNHKISSSVINFRYVLPLFTKKKRTLIKDDSERLFVILNDSIEINLASEKIEYKGIINEFYIISVDDGSENFRTESYLNRDSSNIFTINYHDNFLYSFYKGVNLQLLVSNNTIKVLNKNFTLHQTSYEDLRKDPRFERDCPCWYSNGKVKLHKRLKR